jgi:hypothetical protein
MIARTYKKQEKMRTRAPRVQANDHPLLRLLLKSRELVGRLGRRRFGGRGLWRRPRTKQEWVGVPELEGGGRRALDLRGRGRGRGRHRHRSCTARLRDEDLGHYAREVERGVQRGERRRRQRDVIRVGEGVGLRLVVSKYAGRRVGLEVLQLALLHRLLLHTTAHQVLDVEAILGVLEELVTSGVVELVRGVGVDQENLVIGDVEGLHGVSQEAEMQLGVAASMEGLDDRIDERCQRWLVLKAESGKGAYHRATGTCRVEDGQGAQAARCLWPPESTCPRPSCTARSEGCPG